MSASFDQTDIETGAVLEDKLADEVNQARVLVCMCSPTF